MVKIFASPAKPPSLASAGKSRADIMGDVVLKNDAIYGGGAVSSSHGLRRFLSDTTTSPCI